MVWAITENARDFDWVWRNMHLRRIVDLYVIITVKGSVEYGTK